MASSWGWYHLVRDARYCQGLDQQRGTRIGADFQEEGQESRSPTTPPGICFPGNALVSVQHKNKNNNNNEHELGHSQLEMRHVQVGDRVLGMNGKYTPVYVFGHQAPHLTERYVRIFTNATGSSSGATTPLELSDRHYLYLHKHQEFPVLPADLN
ncbi:hypothetical protein MHU86_20339 [Fragilaria crotonensis]|nr:hypothetical protein MHU86_20339 [Fragilaria crotonensis]